MLSPFQRYWPSTGAIGGAITVLVLRICAQIRGPQAKVKASKFIFVFHHVLGCIFLLDPVVGLFYGLEFLVVVLFSLIGTFIVFILGFILYFLFVWFINPDCIC
ncbi:hypothetical protein BT96DRAFT_256480 [Gymnopus androsaceus JB14]|uniref:Uncharacterized protein n=1 Tax=Gymnopus androsaceus JB14 TaxID=1447944 RepID=A0A6A4H469_9AGAR|nr:hypothetical protein BT96DRAFT_256480 [Gymnopus androsaceus JB14]